MTTVRALARDILPPVVIRTARRLLGSDPLSIARWRADRITLRNGRVLHHRGTAADRGVIHQLFADREYDLRPLARYRDIQTAYDAMPDPLIVDCGANIGASAVWFASVYPKAQIVAIEPERENFALLLRNTNGLRGVHAMRAAVSNHAGVMRVEDPGKGEWGYRTHPASAEDPTAVPAVTIADVVARHGGTPFLLKIDVEGAESEIFDEASALLDYFPLVVIELHDWLFPRARKSRNFLQWQARMDRDFVYRRENVFSISNAIPQGLQNQ